MEFETKRIKLCTCFSSYRVHRYFCAILLYRPACAHTHGTAHSQMIDHASRACPASEFHKQLNYGSDAATGNCSAGAPVASDRMYTRLAAAWESFCPCYFREPVIFRCSMDNSAPSLQRARHRPGCQDSLKSEYSKCREARAFARISLTQVRTHFVLRLTLV